ncbi:MAG TPA: DUF3046 domain-containing protein [Nocardioides sp.]|nr:DUF3046 domain-containing protein [Nocardioides sp.]
MRHTEFWERMDHHLGASYSRTWASTVVMGALDGRTAEQALADGWSTKEVWRAVWEMLDLPASER